MFSQEHIHKTLDLLLSETINTLYMTGFASLFSITLGIIAGITLYVTDTGGILENSPINKVLGTIVNIGRSIPFVILIMAVFPLSKLIVGTTIGSTAAIVPLTIAAFPFAARVIESALNDLNKGTVEAASAMGASPFQIITKVLLPECASGIIMGITITIINLIGYSAMAGIIGGGGLGDVAQRYGFQRRKYDILIVVVIILVFFVQIIQITGSLIAKKVDKR